MQRPVLFIARSWSGHGGMQQLNRDVVRYVGGNRSGFVCIHPVRQTSLSHMSFVLRSIFAAIGHRGTNSRVHVGDVAALPLGVLCAWLGGMKLSVTACGLDVIYPKKIYQWLIRASLRRIDQVICISAATAEEVKKRGVSADRIVIIPCGIDPASVLIKRQRDPLLLLTVGRLVKRKGVAWFIEHVLPLLLKLTPDIRYVILGDGPERKTIEKLVIRMHLEYAVRLLPSTTDAERQDVMLQSALFVAPNIHVRNDMEGFGIVCIEAAASGLQVVASDIEGLKDAVIDGKTGVFFESENPDDCVRVIEQMLTHPFTEQTVHDAALQRYSWTILAPLYHHVFDV